jgi:hypothetical protein
MENMNTLATSTQAIVQHVITQTITQTITQPAQLAQSAQSQMGQSLHSTASEALIAMDNDGIKDIDEVSTLQARHGDIVNLSHPPPTPDKNSAKRRK